MAINKVASYQYIAELFVSTGMRGSATGPRLATIQEIADA